MKIFLLGYMGSGKTAIASHLADKLQYPLIDLDNQIELIEEQSIPDIFKNKGELYFRKRETQVLEDVLKEKSSLVISLGGGTPCYGSNLDLIKNFPDSKIVYLKASVQFLTNRLFQEKENRPLISHLKNKIDLEDFVRKHLFERAFYYNQANFSIDVENKTPDEIAAEIIANLE